MRSIPEQKLTPTPVRTRAGGRQKPSIVRGFQAVARARRPSCLPSAADRPDDEGRGVLVLDQGHLAGARAGTQVGDFRRVEGAEMHRKPAAHHHVHTMVLAIRREENMALLHVDAAALRQEIGDALGIDAPE